MGMLPDTPRTFLNGETLGLDSGGTEELRMPECACNANCHEHTAEVILVKFHAIFLPEPPAAHKKEGFKDLDLSIS